MMGQSDEAVKVCVVGPKACGKTSVCRAMGDWEPLTATYHPTAGVRIQELERKLAGSSQSRTIQLWDCSGDYRYQFCWPGMAKDAQGLVLVYNLHSETENSVKTQKELETWYEAFAVPNKLPNARCKIIALTDKHPKIRGHDFTDVLGCLEQEVVCLTDSATWAPMFAALDSIFIS